VSRTVEFDWDVHNLKHLAKHGISRLDSEDVLSGNHILVEYQMEGDEERWIAVGATRAGRILEIVFAVRGEAIRPITGWPAGKEMHELYAREWGLD
jgi:uncharacterized DUF497 family protein